MVPPIRKTLLQVEETRIEGGRGAPITLPMMDKNDAGRRSHYLTYPFSIADAPAANEIVVALGASVGGRPHHRIGDRYQDLKEGLINCCERAGVFARSRTRRTERRWPKTNG